MAALKVNELEKFSALLQPTSTEVTVASADGAVMPLTFL